LQRFQGGYPLIRQCSTVRYLGILGYKTLSYIPNYSVVEYPDLSQPHRIVLYVLYKRLEHIQLPPTTNALPPAPTTRIKSNPIPDADPARSLTQGICRSRCALRTAPVPDRRRRARRTCPPDAAQPGLRGGHAADWP
jgi:hypothetical protein